MKKLLILASFVAVLAGCDDYTKYVDVFVGTAGTGHTFPAASLPLGLVQAGPDTGNGSWDYCSGYAWKDRTIIGFTQDHLNGTGCPDLGDLRLMPFSSDAEREVATFDKADEKAVPGWYSVKFKNGIATEIAASRHSAIYRFKYGTGPKKLMVDTLFGIWAWGNATSHIVSSETRLNGKTGLSGRQRRHRWTGRDLGFAVEFDIPCASVVELERGPNDKASKYVFTFDIPDGAVLSVKLALSSSGPDAAKRNLASEIPDWDFARVAANGRAEWNKLLSRATIEGTDEQKRNWYTSLYHLYLQPNDIADAGETPYYSTMSLWDTFRAAHPLYTILTPCVVGDFVNSMMRHARERGGRMPIWALWGNETDCMVGNHSIPVVVDWFFKTRGTPAADAVDWSAAFEVMKNSVTVNHPKGRKENWDLLDKYGYYPFDVIKGESVSRTLECSYDDACLARMASALGRTEDAAFFEKRSNNWKNVFDASTGFMRGRDTKGAWRTPYDPYAFGHGDDVVNDFTEGNAFQYTWHVLQDPLGLMKLLGGRSATVEKLDRLFKTDAKLDEKDHTSDISGLIGQYVHGNEPSHHVIYFYTLAGRPDRAAECLREVFDRFYFPRPDGLCGNDDCGQMSAWYIFSAMGFYPFDPASGEYVIGAPQVPKVTIALPGGKTFTVIAKNLSIENKYVRSVKLNGKPLAGVALKHADLMAGGELVFEMTDVPVVPVRVGSSNVRTTGCDGWVADEGTPNTWNLRKADFVSLLRRLEWDVFGLQEVCPEQLSYLREQMPEWEFVGDHRGADRKSDEASPVAYRKSRFGVIKKGTFWLSETPDVPGKKGWGAACPRVCSYLVLHDKLTGGKFCFANTHTDHVSEQARLEGMKLVIRRMKEFGAGCPIVFTGDHNCTPDAAPALAMRELLQDARDISETPLRGSVNSFHGWGKYVNDPKWTIDYIYVSDGTRVCDFETFDEKRPGTDLYPSDHFPIGATVVLPDCPCCDGIAPFGEDERVAFFGDSITHGGGYVTYLQLFQNLRCPGSSTRVMNVGIGGDTAADGIRRLDWDLMAQRPDRVFVMFGMNDVGRLLWNSPSPSEQQVKGRRSRLDAYSSNERAIVDALTSNGVNVVLMTPTPYDQYSAAKAENLSCCNEPGLASCAAIVRELALEKGLPVIDFHAPLTAIQKTHADHVFCSDRVHPDAVGHLLMAAHVLEAMRVSPFVGEVTIDAEKAERTEDGIAFDYRPAALPFPKLPEYVKTEEYYPLTERLNREMIAVKGLELGGEFGSGDARERFAGKADYRYEVAFDGCVVGTFAASDLMAGVNVALLNTPNQRRAQEAAKIAEDLHRLARKLRQNTLIQCRLHDKGISFDDFKAADAYLDGWLAEADARKDGYCKTYHDWVREYRAFRNEVKDALLQENELRAKLAAIRPVASRVTISRKK